MVGLCMHGHIYMYMCKFPFFALYSLLLLSFFLSKNSALSTWLFMYQTLNHVPDSKAYRVSNKVVGNKIKGNETTRMLGHVAAKH